MSIRIPRQALLLLKNTVVMASKYGLKKGMAKAAVKANPALLLLEAAVSVAEAVNSYINLKEARLHRDGMTRFIQHEGKRLELERQKLADQIALAKQELSNNRKVQQRMGELVLACSAAYRLVWDELHAIRSSDLPDLDAFDTQLIELEDVWRELQIALQYYTETSA